MMMMMIIRTMIYRPSRQELFLAYDETRVDGQVDRRLFGVTATFCRLHRSGICALPTALLCPEAATAD